MAKNTSKKEIAKKTPTPVKKAGAFQLPMQISAKLKALLGVKNNLPRTELSKLAWVYAKGNNLKTVTESGDTFIQIDKGLYTLRNAEHPVKLGKKISVYEFVRLFNSHIGK